MDPGPVPTPAWGDGHYLGGRRVRPIDNRYLQRYADQNEKDDQAFVPSAPPLPKEPDAANQQTRSTRCSHTDRRQGSTNHRAAPQESPRNGGVGVSHLLTRWRAPPLMWERGAPGTGVPDSVAGCHRATPNHVPGYLGAGGVLLHHVVPSAATERADGDGGTGRAPGLGFI